MKIDKIPRLTQQGLRLQNQGTRMLAEKQQEFFF
jgi:hypothetical protein